ncbi:MAG: hypothetical protein EPGJADBJ_01712 [Saprospiraceae bacterium]|nr:hypothetical protein [Saprospiraceae bacterium]
MITISHITTNLILMQFKTILPLLILLTSAFISEAQRNVRETERMMSFGSRPGFRLEFPGATTSVVEDQWKDWTKKHYSAKLKKKKNEWSASELKSSMLGPDPFSLYSVIEKTADGAALTVWYDMGSSFLNSRDNPLSARETSSALQQFYYDVRRATYDMQAKNEEKKLKDLEDNNKAMEKKSKELQKSIEDYRNKIKKAEEEILQLAKNQEVGLINIENQKKVIEDVKQRKLNVESEGN